MGANGLVFVAHSPNEAVCWYVSENCKTVVGTHRNSKMGELVAHNNNLQVCDLTEDLGLLSKWVKEDLFRGCKFVYRGKADLELPGVFYSLFKAQCGPKLAGFRQAVGEDARRSYLEKVWIVGVRQNSVSNGLALRRSGIYTVMQNRFMGE